jgi:hypothetical protein
MTQKKKRFLMVAILLLLVVVIGLLIYFFVIADRGDGGMRVASVSTSQSANVADYSQSRLFIYDNGTFDVEIVFKGDAQFSGIGTYVRTKNAAGRDIYLVTYLHYWTQNGATIETTTSFEIRDGGVRVVDHTGSAYLFK